MDRGFQFVDAAPFGSNRDLWPALLKEIDALPEGRLAGAGVFDLGCGNGATAGMLAARGLKVTGVDTEPSGIAVARAAHPGCRFDIASAEEDLAAVYGQFPLVVSLEVVEHLYDPHLFARRLYDLAAPGGTALVSTPYHGYAKNLAIAVAGKFDGHFSALWTGGHIKFFSVATLTDLLSGAGFEVLRFHRVGRIPILARSMLAVARRPG